MAFAKSHSQSVLPNPRSLVLDVIESSETGFSLAVHVEQVPCCPECGQRSRSCHSSYLRRLQDLPWQGSSVQILLRVRRFRCRNHACLRKVFTERVEGIPSYLRQTTRLAEIVRVVGYAAGGLPGARLLARLAIRISDDTVLRRVKIPAAPESSEPVNNAIEVLGVDDWAWRKGRSYGTILVDLEQRCVSDLLPDRSAESFQTWLLRQQSIRVISRDRGGSYSEGARLGAPAAQQVTDRFHLFLNLSSAIERALEERRHQVRLTVAAPPQPETIRSSEVRLTHQQALQQERRHRRLKRYEEVMQQYRQGDSLKRISRTLHLDRRTVRRWIRAGAFPERQRPCRRTQVQRFADYLQRRWAQGCHNATRLFEELRAQGYRGGRSMVARHVAAWRNAGLSVAAARTQQITPKQATMLLSKPPAELTAEQQALFQQLSQQCSQLLALREFFSEFREVFQRGEASLLCSWMTRAQHSGLAPLAHFAAGLERDFSAVLAAVETGWSNGQVEGQINRLKTLKRQMYGRAGFTLLRARVLPYEPLPIGPHTLVAA